MQEEGEARDNLVHQPGFDLWCAVVAKAEACLWFGNVDGEEIVHPLLDEHPK